MNGKQNRIPPLSIVIVAYNTRDLVLQCLSGLYAPAQARGWQIIVVDNGSGDGTWHAVSERFPEVELVRSEQNLGFAAGANLLRSSIMAPSRRAASGSSGRPIVS